nr:Ig-like domain-containing protein [Microbacterium sp. No. 7]
MSTTTRLGALLPLHVNRILPTTLIATVATADRTAPSGAVEFREGDTLIATVPVRHGLATHRLGTLSRGTHRYTATFVPSDPALYAGSVSDPAPVRVLF